MNKALQAIRDHDEALDALSDDELVTLVLLFDQRPWGNTQDAVFRHAAPRLAAKLASLGWSEDEDDLVRHLETVRSVYPDLVRVLL